VTVGSFADALRPEAVLAELVGAVSHLSDGNLTFLACRISRIRSLPERDTWTAIYELDVRDAGSGLERTVVTRGLITPPGLAVPQRVERVPFGAEGWSQVVPALGLRLFVVTSDDALLGFDVITDPERGRLLIQDALLTEERLRPGTEVTSYAPTVLAHKPGVRATVLCHLEYDVGTETPTAVVVKVHNDDQGERAFTVMRALSEGAGLACVAPAIAYLPDLRLSIQEYVEHTCSLKDLFHSAFEGNVAWDELMGAIVATAAGLAGVHRSGCTTGEPVTWEQELETVRSKQDRLALVMPTLAAGIGSVPDRLAAAAAAIPADPLAPSHHSFRPAQVLLTDDGVVFIDFDKFCQAEPAADIALFIAKLQHMAVNKVSTRDPESSHQVRLAEVRTAFLEEYQRHAPVSVDRVALWEALELTSLVLSAAKKVNDAWVAACQRLLEDHLRTCGW
jgi:hypothetical protein